jgi:hypothetical protein
LEVDRSALTGHTGEGRTQVIRSRPTVLFLLFLVLVFVAIVNGGWSWDGAAL